MKPDYYLVLPWHFKEEFVRCEEAMLDPGTGFIFPLPTIETQSQPLKGETTSVFKL